MSAPRTIQRVVALMAMALALSLVPTSTASHEEGATIDVRQEPQPGSECHEFFVEVDDASSPSATLQIWEHREGTAPDRILHEERIQGEPDEESGGFDFVAGPVDREHTANETEDLYVRVSWTDEAGFHDLMSDFFNLVCEGGPGPIPDCPTNVEAVAMEDGSIRLSWDAVEGADTYLVFVGTHEIPFSIAGSSDDTVFVYDQTEPGETYVFTVRTFADGSEAIGCDHVEVTAIPFFGAPVLGALAAAGSVGAFAWMSRRREG